MNLLIYYCPNETFLNHVIKALDGGKLLLVLKMLGSYGNSAVHWSFLQLTCKKIIFVHVCFDLWGSEEDYFGTLFPFKVLFF